MSDWVRVKDKRTGHEYSVKNVNNKIHEVVVKKPGARSDGKPLKAKPNVSARAASRQAAAAGSKGEEVK
jgi:hypothetical protein